MLPSETVKCPYCGETVELVIDPAADEQRYVEDCPVCCRPMTVTVHIDDDGTPDVLVESENGA